jgi:hypothetical protein
MKIAVDGLRCGVAFVFEMIDGDVMNIRQIV